MFSSHGSHASNVKVFNLSKFLSLIIKFAVASSYLKNLLERGRNLDQTPQYPIFAATCIAC